jgi:hypothetical protein
LIGLERIAAVLEKVNHEKMTVIEKRLSEAGTPWEDAAFRKKEDGYQSIWTLSCILLSMMNYQGGKNENIIYHLLWCLDRPHIVTGFGSEPGVTR